MSNRIIKFRAWHKSWSPEKNSDGWVDKKGKTLKNGMQGVDGWHVSNRGHMSVKMHDWADYCPVKDDVVLMQYTGLHDRNGKEIYEGDIVRVDDNDTAEVKFSGGSFHAFCEEMGSYMWRDYEVIGNVHEHPHLLE